MQTSNLTVVLLAFLFAGPAFGAETKIIVPQGAKPAGNYSRGILLDGTLFIFCQTGDDAAGKIPGNFEAEVKQSLDKIGATLEAAGMAPSDVVSVDVYLTDAAKVQRINAVYASYFKDQRPARTTSVISKLVGPGNIATTVTARK